MISNFILKTLWRCPLNERFLDTPYFSLYHSKLLHITSVRKVFISFYCLSSILHINNPFIFAPLFTN